MFAVFLLTTAVSVLWVLYVRFANQGRAHAAAIADVGIVGVGMLNVISYTENRWMTIPLLLGTYAGTVIAVRRQHPTVPDAAVGAITPTPARDTGPYLTTPVSATS